MTDNGNLRTVVLTFRRPRLATRTVRWLVDEQRIPAESILLVINGEGGLDDQELAQQIPTVVLSCNLGPAGGYLHGLRLAAADPRVRWIYVVEDDACLLPLPHDHVEQLTRAAELTGGDAAIVSYGRRLDERTGRTVPYEPTPDSGILAGCDVAAWGASLIPAEPVRTGLLPDAGMFFGYEDFDYFLRLRASGVSVQVHTPTALRLRAHVTDTGRTAAFAGERPTDSEESWRLYYQARNFITLARRHGTQRWLLDHVFRSARRWQLAGADSYAASAIVRGLVAGATGTRSWESRYARTTGEAGRA